MTNIDRRISKTKKAIYQALNDYFLRQLHKELEHHVYSVLADNLKEAHPNLPTSYLQHLVMSNFIETLTWWLKKGQDFTDQEVVQFYLDLLIPKN